MRSMRLINAIKVIATGAVMLQIGGCTTEQLLAFVQTILLGITAAGSIAILQNI